MPWERVLFFVLAVPAIVLHEVAHGYSAYLLGDPTAKSQGRLSLNPVRHVDMFGTIILPGLMALSGGPVFGWAKPVPVNPAYFRDRRTGWFITGVSGPAANLTMAIAGAMIARLGLLVGGPLFGLIGSVAAFFMQINLVLMFFNLIPIPPLDGSSVVSYFLRGEAERKYHAFGQYGILAIMALIFMSPYLGVDPIGWYLGNTVRPIGRLLLGV